MRKHNRTFYKVILVSLYFINISFGESVARLIKSEGVVYLKRMGMQTYSEVAQVGASINNGDAIKVGDYGFAALIFIDDRSVVKVKPNSQFEIMDTKNTRSVNIEFGTILNKIEKENRTKTFRVVSPVSVASVKGTEFAAMINPSGVDQFIGKEGLFDVFNSVSGQTVSVGPGQKALSGSTGSLMQAPASPNEYPQDPELEVEERKKPSERDESKKIENDNQQREVETNDSEIKNKTDQINDSTINNEVDSNDSQKTDDAPSSPKKPFGMGLGIGSATIDGTLYNQLALRPEINFAGIGIGLDLVVYMDDEGNIRQDEWDFDDNPDLIQLLSPFVESGYETMYL